ncbi:DUF962 domain-containing protein [Paraferrimonas sp. SM1919]|uniref:DUF962 domain-containing protein n=1 Tax=Paraferrimonas sp. SM1919 TaxID=2662263 RepID=UPI0013D68A4A|nr:DUF962 domain-containing protein [Paraferrimonas sp. SM1919]
MEEFKSFKEFYPFYLSQHQDCYCRALHFIGSLLVIAVLLVAFITLNAYWLIAAPVVGYGFAWVGHFYFEKNKPATFKYPWYSFLGDWVMFKDILLGRLK